MFSNLSKTLLLETAVFTERPSFRLCQNESTCRWQNIRGSNVEVCDERVNSLPHNPDF